MVRGRGELAEMGFVLPDDGEGVRRLAISEDSALHVLRLRGRDEAGGALAMDREAALAVVESGSKGVLRLRATRALRRRIRSTKAWFERSSRTLAPGAPPRESASQSGCGRASMG